MTVFKCLVWFQIERLEDLLPKVKQKHHEKISTVNYRFMDLYYTLLYCVIIYANNKNNICLYHRILSF